jgi:hypothetical protein
MASNVALSPELPGMLLFHGTPQRDDVYLLETVHAEGVTLAKPDEIAERLGEGAWPSLLLCGHTHIPRTVAVAETTIVNPGSVGLQAYRDDAPLSHVMETGSPHARYAILERSETAWRAEHIELPYDWEMAAQRALRIGLFGSGRDGRCSNQKHRVLAFNPEWRAPGSRFPRFAGAKRQARDEAFPFEYHVNCA